MQPEKFTPPKPTYEELEEENKLLKAENKSLKDAAKLSSYVFSSCSQEYSHYLNNTNNYKDY